MTRQPRRSFVFFLASGVGLLGCRPVSSSNTHVSVVFGINPTPPQVGPAIITIRLADAKGQAISGAQLAIEGDMTHPGMNPLFAKAAEITPGEYRGQLIFTMPGDWAVLIHGTTPDGQAIERQFDVKSVRPR